MSWIRGPTSLLFVLITLILLSLPATLAPTAFSADASPGLVSDVDCPASGAITLDRSPTTAMGPGMIDTPTLSPNAVPRQLRSTSDYVETDLTGSRYLWSGVGSPDRRVPRSRLFST